MANWFTRTFRKVGNFIGQKIIPGVKKAFGWIGQKALPFVSRVASNPLVGAAATALATPFGLGPEVAAGLPLLGAAANLGANAYHAATAVIPGAARAAAGNVRQGHYDH